MYEDITSIDVTLPASGVTRLDVTGDLVEINVHGESDGGDSAVDIGGLLIDFAPTSLIVVDNDYVILSKDILERIRVAIKLLVNTVEQLKQDVESLKQQNET